MDLQRHFHSDIAASEQLADWYTTTAALPLPMLEDQALPIMFHAEDISLAAALPALGELSAHGSALRPILADAIYEELQEMTEFLVDDAGDYGSTAEMIAYHGADRGFDDLSPPDGPSDIWRLVRWTLIFVDKAFESERLNIVVCGDLAWDNEHEIGLIFRDGARFMIAADPSYVI